MTELTTNGHEFLATDGGKKRKRLLTGLQDVWNTKGAKTRSFYPGGWEANRYAGLGAPDALS